MDFYRVYTGDDGESHLEQLDSVAVLEITEHDEPHGYPPEGVVAASNVPNVPRQWWCNGTEGKDYRVDDPSDASQMSTPKVLCPNIISEQLVA